MFRKCLFSEKNVPYILYIFFEGRTQLEIARPREHI